MIFTGFYCLHLIGLIYSEHLASGLFELQVKLSLLIFPILLVSVGPLDIEKQKQFIYSFIAGCIINALICLTVAVWKYHTLGVVHLYSQFSLFLHPSYYSMYIDIVVVFIFYLLTEKGIETSKNEKIYLCTSLVFLEFILVILQSKTGLIISIFVLLVNFTRYIIRTKRWLIGIALFAGTIVLAVLTYNYVITSNRSRFTTAENVISSNKMDIKSIESTQARFFVWQSAWKVIKTVPFTGVGTGDTRYSLTEQYAKDNYTGAEKERLNAHNEYLETTVELGVVGLVGLLACLLLPLYKSIKERRFVYLMLLVILMINFLTESMLETQGGTIFYGLFNSLLMFNFVI